MSGPFSGYHDCPCRDCFEIAIGELHDDYDDYDDYDDDDDDDDDDDERPGLCHDCQEAGCSADGDEDCNAPHAYGGACDDPACCPVHPAGDGYEQHAGENEVYSDCPLCNPTTEMTL